MDEPAQRWYFVLLVVLMSAAEVAVAYGLAFGGLEARRGHGAPAVLWSHSQTCTAVEATTTPHQ